MIKNNDFWYSTLEVVFTLLCICIGFLMGVYSVKADVYYGYNANGTSNQIPYNSSVVISNGRVYFRFNDGNVYSDSTTTPLYFKHTFCVDSTISSWNSGGSPNAFKSVSFYKTDTKCYYPGSSYGGGRIMYLYGQTNPSFTCSVSLTNCLNGGYLYFQQDSQASWTLLQESYSINAIDIDFNTNQTNTYNSEITNNTNNTANNTNEINSNITDPSIDTNNTNSSVSNFGSTTNSSMNNTPVSSMISLPITFLTGVNNALSSSCTNVNYIELFDYQLVLPCLNLSERLGSVWIIIDTIFSCMLIFSIGKSLVSTFARLSDMDTNIMYECYANGYKHRGESFDD